MLAPKKIRIDGHTVTIHYFETIDSTREFGSYNMSANRIEIQKGLHHDQERAAVLHEVLHGICASRGLRHKLGQQLEEEVVLALEAGIYQVMRDNPKLFAYLMEKKVD